jgi:hypothetical protein
MSIEKLPGAGDVLIEVGFAVTDLLPQAVVGATGFALLDPQCSRRRLEAMRNL